MPAPDKTRFYLRPFPLVCVVISALSTLAGALMTHERFPLALFAVGAFGLFIYREMVREVHDGEREDAAPPLSHQEQARRAEAAASPGDSGLSCISFEFPPLVCPRDEFEEILARHEAVIRAHLPALLFLARRRRAWSRFVDAITMACAEIDIVDPSAPPRLLVRSTVDTARRFAAFRAIAKTVSVSPGRLRLHAVVLDDDVVSYRKLDLLVEESADGKPRFELVLRRNEVMFAPIRQQVETKGASCVRLWRATATSPLHEEVIPIRPAAASPEEYLDRLFATCQPRLRDLVVHSVEVGRSFSQILFSISPGNEYGPFVLVYAERRDGWVDFVGSFPRCHLALQRPWPRGWLPVMVTGHDFGGIRWFAHQPDADPSARPESITEWQGGATRRATSLTG